MSLTRTESLKCLKIIGESWFAAEDNNKWLLIFDNYDDLKNVDIYDFLDPSSSGSILITSRSRDTGRIGKELEIQDVAEDEALEILRKSARRDTDLFEKGKHPPCSNTSRQGTLTQSELG